MKFEDLLQGAVPEVKSKLERLPLSDVVKVTRYQANKGAEVVLHSPVDVPVRNRLSLGHRARHVRVFRRENVFILVDDLLDEVTLVEVKHGQEEF